MNEEATGSPPRKRLQCLMCQCIGPECLIDGLIRERNEVTAMLRIFAERVEKLAFEMKAPNAYTPQFVMMAQEMRSTAQLSTTPRPLRRPTIR